MERKDYPHWSVRGKLPPGPPGLLEASWDKTTVLKREFTTDHQQGRVILFPEYKDLELIVKLEGIDGSGKSTSFDKWLPLGARNGGAGGTLRATATLQNRDGSAPRTHIKQFRFELHDTSREPGVALNWPNLLFRGADKPPPDDLPDLRFDGRVGQTDSQKQRQTVPPREDPGGRPFAETIIQSFDFGAWSDLVAVAELADGREITGHLKGDPNNVSIPIPKRTRPSFIADAWKELWGVTGPDNSDDETEPVGEPGCNGDGLTLYEEYRGFFENGRHIRTKPKKKDLFIFNPTGALAVPGINLFQRLSGLEVHKDLLLDPTQRNTSERSAGVKGPPKKTTSGYVFKTEDDTVINGYFDRGPHRVMQHFVRIYFRGDTQRHGGGNVGKEYFYDFHYRPKDIDTLYVEEPDAKYWQTHYSVSEADMPRQHDVAVAHELFHAVGVDHHGDGNWSIKVTAYDASHPDNRTGRAAWLNWWNGVATPIRFLEEATGRDITESWALTALGLSGIGRGGEGLAGQDSPRGWYFVQNFQIGVAHGEQSGDEDCVMRYWLADIYPKTGAPKGSYGKSTVFYVVPDGTEPVGSQLCVVRTGKSVNKTPPPPS